MQELKPPGDSSHSMRYSIAIIADNTKDFECFNDIKEFTRNNNLFKLILMKNVDKKHNKQKLGKLFMIPFVTKDQLIYFEGKDQIAILNITDKLFSIISTENIQFINKSEFLNQEQIEIESIYREIPESTIILPSCPVCIKRLDKSISGLNTIKCRDLFHPCCRENCQDISKDCLVCGIINDSSSSVNCSDCSSTENLWICLICSNLGCGRYKSGHAHNHFARTGHAFALKLDSHHIWDYTTDKYVHWNIKSDEGTVVDVDDDIKSSEGARESFRNQPAEDFSSDFTTAQLESQKAYFDERLIALKNEHNNEIAKLNHEHEEHFINLKDEINRLNHERKIFSDLSNQLQEQLKKFKSNNEQLKNDLETERKISQGLSDSYDKLKVALTDTQKEKQDLEDQVKDLMKHIEILDLMSKAGNNPDIVEGKLLIRQTNSKKKFK